MPNMADRKRWELSSKLQALPNELKHWLEISEKNRSFEKHNSQIRRLAPQIEGLHSIIEEDFGNLKTDDELLRDARTIEMRILAVHSVWDYFRSKFILRAQEPFATFLKTADAFAWACYKPVSNAQQRSSEENELKEPPLVSLESHWSPWALPRDHAYNIVRAPGGWTDTEPFVKVTEALPVPIVGLPWFHLEHLPHVVLTAHEVGHVVEHDFELAGQVEAAIESAALCNASRRDAWRCWRKEIFADWFGCYAAGPEFLWALAGVLTRGTSIVTSEKKQGTWGDYPTAALRMRFNEDVLRQLAWNTDAQAIHREWVSTYPSHEMEEFEKDTAEIARALFDADLLPGKLNYRDVRHQENRAVEILSLNPFIPALSDTQLQDPRALVAAAGRLYRSAQPGAPTRQQWQTLRERIVTARPVGVLAEPSSAPEMQKDPAVEKAAGRALAFDFFAAIDLVTPS